MGAAEGKIAHPRHRKSAKSNQRLQSIVTAFDWADALSPNSAMELKPLMVARINEGVKPASHKERDCTDKENAAHNAGTKSARTATPIPARGPKKMRTFVLNDSLTPGDMSPNSRRELRPYLAARASSKTSLGSKVGLAGAVAAGTQ